MDYSEVNARVRVVVAYAVDADIARAARPAKMVWGGREIIFTEVGLYHPSRAGAKMLHIFDMSDGESDYRLAFDAERLSWTLMAVGVAK
jgi:hypothetical protein